jgi:hypothetical protein
MTSGMVITLKILTMDNPQPSPKVFLKINTMDAVHRLNVGRDDYIY